MKIGVLLLNFGEPEEATMDAVVPFLERIFSLNAPLMGKAAPTEAEVRERSRALAEARAPGLIAEYEEIGGSPLHRQAREQAEALQEALIRRGHDAVTFLGMQFTEPSIEEAVAQAEAAGVDVLVSLPVYPLCGPTTNVAALRSVQETVETRGWGVASREISGWHRHPDYIALRVAAIRRVVEENGLSLADPGTKVVFSAHGTPMKYLNEGSRYDEYVREFCARVAEELGVGEVIIGYQNHTNRPGIEWTQPDIEDVIGSLEAQRVIVDPVSFMHEQSETLAELDDELREVAEGRGLEFHRVPIPYLDARFIEVMTDLVEAALRDGEGPGGLRLTQCRCKPTRGTLCTNGRA